MERRGVLLLSRACFPQQPPLPRERTLAGRKKEQEWIISRVLETTEGKHWLREKNDWEKRRRVIVVKGGKLVNVVF
jgi:hypothetical protein